MNEDEPQFIAVEPGGGEAVQIAYRFLPPSPGAPVFIWLCGLKSHMRGTKAEALAAWAARRGAGCLRFDYSGHGESAGRFEDGTIGAWLAEAERVAGLAVPAGRVVFVGSSMGAWIALLLGRRHAAQAGKPAGLVLIAPAWNMTRLMLERAPQEARAALHRDGFYLRPSAYGDGAYVISKALLDSGERHLLSGGTVTCDGPVRILHGCRDRDIPWRHSLALLDLLDGGDVRLTLVKDGEHRLSRPQDLALLFSTLEEFLDPSMGAISNDAEPEGHFRI